MTHAYQPSTLLLSADDVATFLPMSTCITAVEGAFRKLGQGLADPPSAMAIPSTDGGFHVKAAILDVDRRYFAVKTNGNFTGNRTRNRLPTVQGLVILCDADNGRVLAVIDSSEITARRTAAATAVAVKFLAAEDASVAAICGCGVQGEAQLEAIATVVSLRRVMAYDKDGERAVRYAKRMSEQLGLDVEPGELTNAVAHKPDIWITCTTSTEFFLLPEHVKDGAFVAGVGVDSEYKKELAPALLERAHVVTDQTAQCEQIGDLHQALSAGCNPRTVTELGEVVAGLVPERRGPRDICVFDSTGIAVQDVAAAAAAFEAAASFYNGGGKVYGFEFGNRVVASPFMLRDDFGYQGPF